MLALTGKRMKTIDRMKNKDWESLGLTADTRAVMDQIYEEHSKLNAFITDLLGYTKTQFMANITADTAQLLMSMGMYVAGKPTAANFKKMFEDLLAEHPWLRHSNPAVCLAKILYFQKLENDAAEKEDSSDEEEEEVKPKKKKQKKTVERLHRPSSDDEEWVKDSSINFYLRFPIFAFPSNVTLITAKPLVS